MAYEVIKRVSGRAYRYRVESFRDPETRRVRGRWTYLGRVDPSEAGLPERPPKPRSRDRLLDAVAKLLGEHDAEQLSAGLIAREAGVAYGTFYRYFTDRAHAVREALLRQGASLGDVTTLFSAMPGTRDHERARIARWIRDAAETAVRERGIVRAWHVFSNADEAVVRARSEAVENAIDIVAAYLEGLRVAGIARPTSARATAYGLVALVVALGRDAAIDGDLSDAKIEAVTQAAHDLCGLTGAAAMNGYAHASNA